MIHFEYILLVTLLICAVATAVTKKILSSVIIWMAYSTIMAVLWMVLESPDLAITEAAVGTGVTSVLFFITLRRIHLIREEDGDEDKDKDKSENENENKIKNKGKSKDEQG